MLYLVVQDMAYLLVHFMDTLFVHLHQFPIIRDQPVHLDFHIGGLRVDCRREPLQDQLLQLLRVLHVLVRHLLSAVELHVSPVPIGFPEVLFIGPANPAILTQYRGPLPVVEVELRCRVLMQVEYIPYWIMVPTTGGINQA